METSPIIVTSPQSEPDQDNSSLQNPSTNPAEAGTTDETRDEDHETSSIEALNWSEVEEEELAAAQQAEALITQGKSSAGGNGTVPTKAENDDEIATNNESSTNGSTVLVNEEGNVLSTSLLQSINSTVSDEDPQARKLSVIENWASEVTNAVERGEIEMAEDFPDENGATGDDDENEGDENAPKTNGVRKRKGNNKLSPEMVSSMMSSASNGESSVDPLSNAPVLDDGPIWDKGPRIYTFHENRRINQKLTFCLLIAVVLAIGLGLGNLVAHQECEAEYKASQQSQTKPVPVPTATPTPASADVHETIHSYESSSSLPNRQPLASDDENNNYGTTFRRSDITPETPQKPQPSQVQKKEYIEPTIDPKYKAHAETLSRVVNTLDQLSRKIDQFENTTRKLQGVLVIPDEEETTTETPEPSSASSLFDEEVRSDDGIFNDDDEEMQDEEIEIENLIDAIEQTPNYLAMQKTLKRIQETMKYQPRSQLMARKTPRSPEEKQQLDIIIKSVQELKDFERRFVQSERKRLKDEGKLNVENWRTPEEYTAEEKKSIGTRYKAALEDYHKLLENKTPNPIDVLFGEEVEEQDDGYINDYSWPEIPNSLEDDFQTQFAKDLEEYRNSIASPEYKKEGVNIPETSAEEIEAAGSLLDLESETTLESNDDLIVLEQIKETLAKADQIITSEMNPTIMEDNNEGELDNGKFSAENSNVHSTIPLSKDMPPQVPTKAKKVKGKVAKPKSQENGKSTAKASKSKKTGGNKLNGATSNANTDQAQPGTGKNGKQKELKRQGKVKVKSGNNNGNEGRASNGNGLNGNPKSKMASKLKKLKNLDSNKVFENIEGKSVEKGKATRGKDVQSSDQTRQPDINNNGKEKRSPSRDKKSSSRERANNGRSDTYGNPKNNRNNNGQRNPNDYTENKRGNNNHDKSSKLKHEQDDLSTKETQQRQQKQEFNTNYEDRYHSSGNQNNGKKSKNKERERSRERQRAASWGN